MENQFDFYVLVISIVQAIALTVVILGSLFLIILALGYIIGYAFRLYDFIKNKLK